MSLAVVLLTIRPALQQLHSSVYTEMLLYVSIGRRSCLGEVVAKQELFLFLCGLMQNFNIRAPAGVGKLDEIGKGRITRAPLPYQIIAQPRMCF